tara:strand:- start:373 stop:696 length:324 start_codon:yes stop_codon:yes gene_type:complete
MKKPNNCQYCGRCCIGEEVLVEEDETRAITERTNMIPEEFTRVHYYEILPYYVLKQKSNNHCIFLADNGEKYSCEIYESRPKFCAGYPSDREELEFCKKHNPKISEK